MKYTIGLFSVLCLVLFGGTGQAMAVTITSFNDFATTWVEDNDLADYVDEYSLTASGVSGTWSVRALFSDASHTNLYIEEDNSQYTELFDSSDFKRQDVIDGIDLSATYFQDESASGDLQSVISSDSVFAYIVTAEFKYKNILLQVGDILLGFNDAGGDSDYDDFVVQASPTPLPNAIWMLGTGLVALVGIRRYAW